MTDEKLWLALGLATRFHAPGLGWAGPSLRMSPRAVDEHAHVAMAVSDDWPAHDCIQ